MLLLTTVLNYVFTTIIFLFILSIIRLIYKDIRQIDIEYDDYDDYYDEDYYEE